MATNPNDIYSQNQNGFMGGAVAPITSFGMPSMYNPNSATNPNGMGIGLAPVNTSVISGFGQGAQGGGGLFGGMTGAQGIGLGLQGLQTIGGLIGSFGQLGLAKKQFKLQKDVLNTNLTNQIQAYNTSLDDKARSRAKAEGQSDSERDAYIEENKARRG